MIARHTRGLVLSRPRYLADAAAAEVASREKHYPAMIGAGEIERGDAETDLAAWRTIAILFSEGEASFEFAWATLELATARALQRTSEKVEDAQVAGVATDSLARRRDAVQSIHTRIAWHRLHWAGTAAAAAAEAA